MFMKALMASSLLTLVSMSSAQAADIVMSHQPIKTSPLIVAPSAFSWTGFYLGGQLGDFLSKPSSSVLAGTTWASIDKDSLLKPSGGMIGLYGGFNIDFSNNLVLGIDTDIAWSGKKDQKSIIIKTDEYGDIPKNEIAFRNHLLKHKWSGATRVRLGFSANNLMPYVAGGIAYTQLNDVVSISMKNKILPESVVETTKTMVGYTLGGGIDFVADTNMIMRVEYRYSDFGKKKFAKNKYELSYKTNDFRIGVAYKF
ncbi:outer membrane protein [Bartonella sp. F02]|uniref:outer membrane protein n=1 Tax=Bartonella sp. F02 TaxID=2967262 RepID=UPI0022A9A3B1|nr:outer membrane protein [Bartonella sp. F02]MCZ2328094.1 porin family protein [Bartonella sp. F02]